MAPGSDRLNAPRTYWHLQSLRRKPTDYEIATSRLLYHPQNGFEVQVPLAAWHARHQQGSLLQCDDWERFADPRETTYTRYTTLQNEQEMFVDALLRAIHESDYDARLGAPWRGTLEAVVGVLRYPVHGLQMVAAYVAHLAPASRITICAAMQSADEVRRIQRLAYRLRQLQDSHPGFGEDSRAAWERDPAWQGLRELVERLLVTWDWGEAFVALQFAVKPALDRLFMECFAGFARQCGDDRLESLFFSLNEDCRWHRRWSAQLLAMACADAPANRAWAQERFEHWLAPALAAAEALRPRLAPATLPGADAAAGWRESIERQCRADLGACLGATAA